MDFLRQTNIFNPKKQKSKIFILGAGSTGSFIVLTLAKMGFRNLNIIDFDKIESHNIPNQFYRIKDINNLKVNAIKEIVKSFSGTEIATEKIKIDKNHELDLDLNSIVVFCLDNIKTRQIVYNQIKDYPIKLIDTRMGGEGYQIYSIDLDNEEEKKFYEERLKTKTQDTVCGEKSIIYTILSIASETCQIIKNMDKGENYPKILKREMRTYKILNDLEIKNNS